MRVSYIHVGSSVVKVFSGILFQSGWSKRDRVYSPTQKTVKLDKIWEMMAFKSLGLMQQRMVSLKYGKHEVSPVITSA